MTLSEAVSGFSLGYFSTCRMRPKTEAAYKLDLDQMLAHVGGSELLKEVSAECLEGWAYGLRSRGYASVSIRRKFATARVFFKYWLRKGAIERSPFWRIRLDLERQRMLPRNLAPSDAKRLIEELWRQAPSTAVPASGPASPAFLRLRDLAAVEILFATGIRVGELVSLSLGDWRDDDSSLIVNGKGSRQRLAMLPDDRSVRAFKMYLAHRVPMRLDHEALFVNAGGKRISTQGIARIIKKTAEGGGITTRITPHMVRHTVATMLLRYGADIRVVQEILGHASISTTQRYTHVSKEHVISTLRLRHPNYHLGIDIGEDHLRPGSSPHVGP